MPWCASDINLKKKKKKLSFVSKLVERAVSNQLQPYLTDNSLYAPCLSSYRPNHSTETALLRVHNDLFLRALDNGEEAALVLLDLSAAFDTINHDLLLQRLKTKYGITGTAHKWMESYITNREQSVVIGSNTSHSHPLDSGVPQGSVMGPSIFIMYSAPLEDVIKSHGINCISYADDTPLFCTFHRDKRAETI